VDRHAGFGAGGDALARVSGHRESVFLDDAVGQGQAGRQRVDGDALGAKLRLRALVMADKSAP